MERERSLVQFQSTVYYDVWKIPTWLEGHIKRFNNVKDDDQSTYYRVPWWW